MAKALVIVDRGVVPPPEGECEPAPCPAGPPCPDTLTVEISGLTMELLAHPAPGGGWVEMCEPQAWTAINGIYPVTKAAVLAPGCVANLCRWYSVLDFVTPSCVFIPNSQRLFCEPRVHIWCVAGIWNVRVSILVRWLFNIDLDGLTLVWSAGVGAECPATIPYTGGPIEAVDQPSDGNWTWTQGTVEVF